MAWMWSVAGRLAKCRSGVSAVEFALVAPMLCFGVLAMIDVATRVSVKMDLDRSVRAGVQAIMTLDREPEEIRQIILLAAGSLSPSVTVETQCACGSTTAACTAACDGGAAPSAYFAVVASRPQPGIMLPHQTITSSLRVQVR
jgi:pilus assembly protein CpaE